jgi:hypothetical protein
MPVNATRSIIPFSPTSCAQTHSRQPGDAPAQIHNQPWNILPCPTFPDPQEFTISLPTNPFEMGAHDFFGIITLAEPSFASKGEDSHSSSGPYEPPIDFERSLGHTSYGFCIIA